MTKYDKHYFVETVTLLARAYLSVPAHRIEDAAKALDTSFKAHAKFAERALTVSLDADQKHGEQYNLNKLARRASDAVVSLGTSNRFLMHSWSPDYGFRVH